MYDEIYKFGYKIGATGAFSNDEMIMIQNSFFVNKEFILEIILEVCCRNNIEVCNLFIENLSDFQTIMIFLIGVNDGKVKK